MLARDRHGRESESGRDQREGPRRNPSCRDRSERMVRNPANGEQLKMLAGRQVKVTIARRLKDSVNG